MFEWELDNDADVVAKRQKSQTQNLWLSLWDEETDNLGF